MNSIVVLSIYSVLYKTTLTFESYYALFLGGTLHILTTLAWSRISALPKEKNVVGFESPRLSLTRGLSISADFLPPVAEVLQCTLRTGPKPAA